MRPMLRPAAPRVHAPSSSLEHLDLVDGDVSAVRAPDADVTAAGSVGLGLPGSDLREGSRAALDHRPVDSIDRNLEDERETLVGPAVAAIVYADFAERVRLAEIDHDPGLVFERRLHSEAGLDDSVGDSRRGRRGTDERTRGGGLAEGDVRPPEDRPA